MNFCNVKKFLVCLCFVVVSQCNCLNVSIECKAGVHLDLFHANVRNVSQECNIKDLKEFVQKAFNKDNCFFSRIIVDCNECSMSNIEDDIVTLKKTVECENDQFLEGVIRNATLHSGKAWIDDLQVMSIRQKALLRIDELDDLSKDLKMICAFHQGWILGSRQQINFEFLCAKEGFATDVDQLNIEVDGRNYSIEQINDDINVLKQLIALNALGKPFRITSERIIKNEELKTGSGWMNGLKGENLHSAAKVRIEKLKDAISQAKDAEIERLRSLKD